MTRNIFLLALFSLFLLISSCVSRKNIVYFQNLEQVEEQLSRQDNNITIKPDDLLTIKVFAPTQTAAMPFNLTLTDNSQSGGGSGGSGGNGEETYMVSNEGTIKFPVLGVIEVEGFTSLQLAEKLQEDLQDYVKDPTVNVRILNFQVSIIGEVNSTITVQDDHISLPKALSMAGGIPLTGKRKNILVMREEDGEITHAYLDITDSNIINSPYYNLRQNDIIYIEPTAPRRQTAGYLGTISTYLGLFSAVLSVILILSR